MPRDAHLRVPIIVLFCAVILLAIARTPASSEVLTYTHSVNPWVWNLLGVPADPVNPDPLAVFAAVGGADASLEYFESETQGYQIYGSMFGWTGPIIRGTPYWSIDTQITRTQTISFQGTKPTGSFVKTCPSPGYAPYWVMFATPFDALVSADAIQFRRRLGLPNEDSWRSWVDAYANADPQSQLVDSNAQGWDASAGGFKSTTPTEFLGENSEFRPWWGYWLLVYTPDPIEIRFPFPSTLSAATPNVVDDGAFTNNATHLHATWTLDDPDGLVEEYQYAIGTFLGANDVVDWTSVGTQTGVTKTGLALVEGSTYYFTVKARNTGGSLWSNPGNSDGIRVDTMAPTGTIQINGTAAYTTSAAVTMTLSAADAVSGVSQMRFSSDGTTWDAWETYATSKGRTLPGADGPKTVYVQFKDAAGNASISFSDQIVLDTMPPTTVTVTDDGVWTENNQQLHAFWTPSSDPESSVVEYQYAIGTTPGGTSVVGWTTNGTATSVTRTGLSLTNGTAYYLSVKARNGAGLWSSVASSDGITVDTTAPTGSIQINGGATYTSSADVALTLSATDGISGASQMRLSDDGATWDAWEAYAVSKSRTLPGADGMKTVYVQFKDAAGNASGSFSDQISLDATQPAAVVVTDDGTWTGSNQQLHATWTASIASVSGVAEYQYAVGTTPGGTGVVGWTSNGTALSVNRGGLSLTDGVHYYLSVKARSGAGLWSSVASSDGITVDTTAPTGSVQINGGVAYTSSAAVTLALSATDAVSGVSQMRLSSDGTTWDAWETYATSKGRLLPGADGSKTVYVQFKDAAGNVSSSYSDQIVLDTTPPTTVTVTDDGVWTENNQQLHASWTASSDSVSGIAEYQYAIGTTSGGSDVAGWTSNGSALSVTRGLMLVNGTTYYLSVKARNGAGLWSSIASSDGITIVMPPQWSLPTQVDSTGTVKLGWTWIPGPCGFEYAEVLYSADNLAWTNHNLFELPGPDSPDYRVWSMPTGTTRYFRVVVHDASGIHHTSASQAVNINATATLPDWYFDYIPPIENGAVYCPSY